MNGTDDSKKIKELIEALTSRLRGLKEKVSPSEIQTGKYYEAGFIPLIEETLKTINSSESLNPELNVMIRRFLAELSQYHILPESAVWPRRYLYEKTYLRKWEEPQKRFIYKALDSLYKTKGFKGWEDPAVADVREEFEDTFREFYSIRLSNAWQVDEKSNTESILTPENEAALKLGKTLVRLFYVEGLAAELLDAWKKYEEFIYLTPHYRDHLLHLVYDFLLGCRIFDGLLPSVHENWKYYTNKQISLDHFRVRIMRSWLIASLFHDIGYTAETLESLQKTLQKTFFSKVPGLMLSPLKLQKEEYILHELNDFLTMLSFIFTEDEFSFDFERLMEFKEKKYYPESLIFGAINSLLADQVAKLDHGVMSALFLLLTLKVDIHEFTMEEDEKESLDVRVNKFRRERSELLEDVASATLAIALHNMRQIDYQGLTIDFTSHPISFMLALCDQLHEWDRQSNWSRRDDPFKAVYGFDVFPALNDPKSLFEDKVSMTTLEGVEYQSDSFFHYLKTRINTYGEKPLNIESKLRQVVPLMQDIINKSKGSTNLEIKMTLRKWIDTSNLEPELKSILKALILNLTNDILTLIYVGGNKQTRGHYGDRIGDVWDGLHHLFHKNLSWGPAACILHGYKEDQVGLFFVAEYRSSMKEYVFDGTLKPKRKNQEER